MKNLSYLILILALSLTACKKVKKEVETTTEDMEAVKAVVSEAKKLKIELAPKSESDVTGTVFFKEEDGTVSMTVMLSGLEPGEHAIHIHASSDCSSPDGTSAGGHWNPTAQPHGKWGMAEGYHKGDIGNFTADENGNATVSFSTDEWCIGCDDETKNIIGKGVIVHAGADDFTSQPSGAAGARVSCAGIIE
ncbi:superoxide dismutase family protein [Tamlana flava]|uniref:superoxide dismutase family protein n=1 Tax=Tamlana flava TaxID=3158572 RepID=UPI00351AC428